MSRTVFTALLLLAASHSTAAAAQSDPEVRFEVRGQDDDYVQLRIRRNDWEDNGSWNQRIALADLKGMTRADIGRDGPVSFAYVRPAGRFDCRGKAQDGWANGSCTLTVNEAFDKYLADHKIERPKRYQYFSLTMSGVDSDVIDALVREGLGTPTIDQLVGLGVFRITPDFIRDMAHINGFKVAIRDLVQFKIFKITPESVRAYAALGYRNLGSNDLVTFSIHRITPDYLRELADLGYRDVPAQMLVQMRIFGVTPTYIRSMRERTGEKLSPEALVKRRLTGMAPRTDWARTWQRDWRGPFDRDRRNRRD
ncbi:MAG: hypothetical protein J7494_02455 [Sphingobium sp.]|nr:hypothetical protein [Sphingobium sp.]